MTIYQIARKAGVSIATVSRVINGRPGPSIRTANRVNAVIEKMGYTPAPIERRRGMRKQVSAAMQYHQVALVMMDRGFLRHPELFAHTVCGIERALADQGLGLIIATNPMRLPAAIRYGHIDGLLLSGSYMKSQPLLDQLPDVPRVWLTSYQDPHQSHVLPGNEAAGYLAAEYLLEHARGPVGVIKFEPQFLAHTRRTQAFQLKYQAVGRTCQEIALAPGVAVESATSAEVTRALTPIADAIATRQPALGGLFCAGDYYTARLYPLLLQRGVRPMQDLLIVSCDHETCFLVGLYPKPLTIRIGYGAVGQRAVQKLLARIARPESKDFEGVTLGAELVLPEEIEGAD